MTQQHYRGESGAVLYLDRAALPEGFSKRIARGDLAPCTPDGSPLPDPAGEIDDQPPPGTEPLPKRTDRRDDWIQFALRQGMDREQANAMTKGQLIEEFTRVRD